MRFMHLHIDVTFIHLGQDLVKGTLWVWKSKLRDLDDKKELTLINIAWNFKDVIFSNRKDMSVRALVYNVFLNVKS